MSTLKQRREETAAFREETQDALWKLDDRTDQLATRMSKQESRLDACLQYANLVVENSKHLEQVWVTCVEGGAGTDGRKLKQGVANALGQECAERLGLQWPLTVPEPGASEAAVELHKLVQTFYAALKLCTVYNCNPQRPGGTRKPAHFTIYFAPNMRAMDMHRCLSEGLEKALMHASGLSFTGEAPPGPGSGRRFNLFPEKTAAQRERKRRRRAERAADVDMGAAAPSGLAAGSGGPAPAGGAVVPAVAAGAPPHAALAVSAAKGSKGAKGKSNKGKGKGTDKGKGPGGQKGAKSSKQVRGCRPLRSLRAPPALSSPSVH